MNELENSFNYIEKKYYNITQLKVGDKLYFDNKKNIHIDESSIYQSFNRWYYQRNRYDFINKIVIELDYYYKFRSNYLNLKNDCLKDNQMFSIFNKIINRIDIFHEKLLKGLDNLKITYKDDKIITFKISQLISIIS